MADLLKNAGFTNIKLEVKENAAEIISGWMPGSGAEKYVTSVYVMATKPASFWGVRDDPVGKAGGLLPQSSACCAPVAEPETQAAKAVVVAAKPAEDKPKAVGS